MADNVAKSDMKRFWEQKALDNPMYWIATDNRDWQLPEFYESGGLWISGQPLEEFFRELGIGPEEAKRFIEAYFERYPGVKNYLETEIENAKTKGFVTTLMLRRRYIPEINNRDARIRQFAERTAVNTPIQGSAADLIKKAMIDIHDTFAEKKVSAKLILQVHDELVFELPKSEIKKINEIARDKMENVISLKVPIKVRMKIGKDWLDMKDLD